MSADAATSPSPAAKQLQLFATLLLLASGIAAILCILQPVLWPKDDWIGVFFPLLAVAATLINLARTLPAQNIIAASVLIAVMSGVADIINAKSHVPFGSRTYTDSLGPQFLGVPWVMPLIWIAAVLNSRGVARLILRPWRKTTKYGLWVIGVACVLTVVFDFNLEPIAATNSWWIWQMPKSVPAWQTAPCINFVAWAVVALLILAFTTPWLINKQRPRSSPPDFHPLFVWLLLNVLPAAGDAARDLWVPAIVALVLATGVTAFAVRGAKW